MRRSDPNLPLLILVADALGDLCEDLVFVGGCAAGLLLTDSAAGEVRATQDVDAIVAATRLTQFYAIEARLPSRGFVRDAESGVICRWRHRDSGALFDLMPTDPGVLGFANRWYPEAVRTATRERISARIEIRLISAPAFVATKLEAFATRGRRDYLQSHDLEDVLNVVEGRPTLPTEMRQALPDLRASVQDEFRALLAKPDFIDSIPGLVSDQNQAETVLNRLREMAA